MGIKLAKFVENNETLWGVIEEDRISVLNTQLSTLNEMLNYGKENIFDEVKNGDLRSIDVNSVELLSPVDWPSKVVCQGANYSTHREESGLTANRPPYNLIFSKDISSLTGAYSTIVKPDNVEFLDYEIEVGLIIGSDIDTDIRVDMNNISQYVAGLVIVNDISARDVQLLEGQWYKGKSYRTFGPTGPYIYLLEENEYPSILDLEIQLWVNNELRQSASTSQLLFKPDETLTELSQIMNFKVGDLIITGTTGGVAMSFDKETLSKITDLTVPFPEKKEEFKQSQKNNDKYLKEGDVIKCQVKSNEGSIDLGTQLNKVTVYQSV